MTLVTKPIPNCAPTSFAPFVHARKRDAWFVIRGFVYQVDLSIQRWLLLDPSLVLELECGEDIDQVAVAVRGLGPDRLLEQVKVRQSAVTLRSDTAMEALANALEHRRANPSVSLSFRFITNADIGRERPCPFPLGQTGIERWELVRQSALPDTERQDALMGIRKIIATAKRPEGVSQASWKDLLTYAQTSTEAELLDFVCVFEWSTAAMDPPELRQEIERLLQEKGFASDEREAASQYERLFLHTFKLLTQKGLKQLTAQARSALLSLPTLSATDHATLTHLRALLASLTERVGQLEVYQQRQALALTVVQTEVQRLADAQGLDAAVTYVVATPTLDPPPPVERGSLRHTTVDRLMYLLGECIWLEVCASAGYGKTQLAVRIVERTGCPMWMGFRDCSMEQASQRLDAGMHLLCPRSEGQSIDGWYSTVASAWHRGSTVVLDDLPRMDRNDPLAHRLLILARSCENHGVHLVTTSTHYLPSALRESIGRGRVHSIADFPLQDSEADEILSAYGAPEGCPARRSVSAINNVAQRHPEIFVAIARYLQVRGWGLDDDTVRGLFDAEYADEVHRETMARLLKTVTNAEARELLYRLQLPIGSFPMATVRTLAAVVPLVDRPGEQLSVLSGLWVQSDAAGKMAVSPLIRSLGTGELRADTKKDCYRALGQAVAGQRKLTGTDLANAIVYFAGAEDPARAATFLALGLGSMHSHDMRRDPNGLLSIWWDMPLPAQIPLPLRLHLRGLQVAIGYSMGRDIRYALEDIVALVDQSGQDDAWGVLSAAVHASPIAATVSFSIACRLVAKEIQYLPSLRLPGGEPLSLPDSVAPEALVWTIVGPVDDGEKLDLWLALVEGLSREQRERAFNGSLAVGGCKHLPNRLWMAEADKHVDEQDWDRVCEVLEELAARAQRMGEEFLWAGAIAGLIVAHAEYRKDLPRAVEIGRSALALAREHRSRFVIGAQLGLSSVHSGGGEVAPPLLAGALVCDTDVYPHERMLVHLHLARLHGSEDPVAAVAHAEDALRLARAHPEEIPERELVKAAGELAIARWLADDRRGAFMALDDAAASLLEARDDSVPWKALFGAVGHVSGYLTSMAVLGEPPAEEIAGSPYVEPKRGMLLNPHVAIASTFRPERVCFLPAQLAGFAEAVGEDEKAVEWALAATAMARDAGQLMAIAAVSDRVVVHLTALDRFAEALDVAREAAMTAVAAMVQHKREGSWSDTVDVVRMLGQQPSPAWKQVDELAVWTALVPATVRICQLATEEPTRAVERASELVALCRQLISGDSSESMWEVAATLIERALAQPVGLNQLRRDVGEAKTQDSNALLVLGRLAESVHADIRPDEALAAQLSVLPLLHRWFGSRPFAWRHLVVPFVTGHWCTRFARQRLLFRAPQLIDRLLAEACTAEVDIRVQRTLQAASIGLSLRIPAEVQQWLSGHSRVTSVFRENATLRLAERVSRLPASTDTRLSTECGPRL